MPSMCSSSFSSVCQLLSRVHDYLHLWAQPARLLYPVGFSRQNRWVAIPFSHTLEQGANQSSKCENKHLMKGALNGSPERR